MRHPAYLLLFGFAAAQHGSGESIAPGNSPSIALTTVTFMSDVYTIPIFDPSNALTYGASKTTIYRPTDLTESVRHSHSSTISSTSPTPSKSSATTSVSVTSPSSDASSSINSIPPAPAEQTGGAISRTYSCGTGSLVGGIVAGMLLM